MSSIAHLRRNPTTKTMILIGTGVVGAAALVYFLWPSAEEEEEKREPALAFKPERGGNKTGAGTKRPADQFKLDTSSPDVQRWLASDDAGRVEYPLYLKRDGTQLTVTRDVGRQIVAAGEGYYLGAMKAAIAEGEKPKSSGKGLSFRPKSDAERAVEETVAALEEFNERMAANNIKT